jgi:opine dehydrogenase
MIVAILGSGNGGCAAAAEWSLAGHEVRLFDFEQFPTIVEAVRKNGGVHVEGELIGFATVAYSGHSIENAVKGADLVLAIGPAYSSEPFAEIVKEHLTPNQIYIVCPGSFGGALISKKIFSKCENASKCIVAETSTLPYAARIIKPGSVMIYHRLKDGLYLAAIPNKSTDKALEVFRTVYTGTIAAKNVLQTMLQNANPIIHPAVMVLNAGLIESTHGDFFFYEDGVTPSVGKMIKAMDTERIMIGKALGVDIIPDGELGVVQGYMTDPSYEYGYSSAPGFKGVKAPDKLDNRYLNEDVGYGLVFMSDMAKKLNLEVPNTNSIINIASVLMQRDYRKEAVRTLDTLGVTIQEILEA